MHWSSWTEFFAMGGYGVYVWGSYIVTLVCVVGEIMLISKRRRTLVDGYGLIHDSNSEKNSSIEALPDTGKPSDTKKISNVKETSNTEEIKNETTS